MADFLTAYENGILAEGGYVLTNHKTDTGGMTYAGISRKWHPNWPGWKFVDEGKIPPTQLVREFYFQEFWRKIQGDLIEDQAIADSIFNFAINADWQVAVKIVQVLLGTTPDGVMGPKTLQALNGYDKAHFHKDFALGKIARYAEICNRNRAQTVNLLGWVNRTLKEL
jgi:lysozyme family protein